MSAAASAMAAAPWVLCTGAEARGEAPAAPREAAPREASPLSPVEVRVLRVVDLLAVPTVARIAAGAGLPLRGVHVALRALDDAGLVREERGAYTLTDEGERELVKAGR